MSIRVGNNNNNLPLPGLKPVDKQQPLTVADIIAKPANAIDTKSNNRVAGYASHAGAAKAVSFPTGGQTTTRDTLINALKKSDLGAIYNGDPAKRAKMDKIADLCITVGQRENVDPKLLFAIAMQESDCGTNKKSSGAAGAMGILPGALNAVKQENGAGLEKTTLSSLRNDDEKCITVSARYLKVVSKEAESKTKGNTGISSQDLQAGNLNHDTWKILSAYRFGAGAALGADGSVKKHYEKDFQNYLSLLNVNIVRG